MKKYAKNINDRKVLVNTIKDLTGLEARYTFVPRCAYEIGKFTVEKDGSLTVEDGADETVIQLLQDENLIGEELEVASVIPRAAAVQPMPNTEPVLLPAEDWEDEEWGEDDETDEVASDPAPAVEAPTETSAEEDEDEVIPTFEFPMIESPDDAADEAETEDADPIPDAEYEQEAEEESAASLGIRGTDPQPADEAPVTEEPQRMGFPMDLEIGFPLSKHSVTSLSNLICMIFSRGHLLERATGGEFHADKDLVNAILDDYSFRSKEELIAFIREWEDSENPLVGIRFTEDKVEFDGFKAVPDEEHAQTYTHLAEAMNKMAISQNRVQAKDVDMSNEKYALRIWLIRLGMNGSDAKADRKRLMENLGGHTAFRTEEEKERAKAKAIKKRDALRALKAESAAQTGASTEAAGA